MRGLNDNAINGNRLYFGDNLEILRSAVIPDHSVDLIYLDPPFNSKAQYNVLFQSPIDEASSAQAGAFVDTWTWLEEAELSYKEIMEIGGGIAKIVDALKSALGKSDMMAYLVMMAVRLEALRSKLKPDGSLYLHCDPTASHYLKILLDGIFGADGFANEIIWKRTGAHGNARRWGPVHDTILFYTMAPQYKWNKVVQPYEPGYIEEKYRQLDKRGHFQDVSLTGPGLRKGHSGRPWRGYNPTDKGRHWAVPEAIGGEIAGLRDMTSQEKLDALEAVGLIYWGKPRKGSDGFPRLKQYPGKGNPIQDIITDISAINSQAEERLPYRTQKPVALLDRIIRASSDEGDVVLDPFCGCGTTIEAATKAGRTWIGIDVAIHATKVIEARIGDEKQGKYSLQGIPRDFESAKRLAEKNKYQFQWWANYLFNPHAFRERAPKKGADRGIDGELFFPNGPGRPWGRMLTSVKGGDNVGPAMVREFAGTLDTEKAEMGLFICLHRATVEMQVAATRAGFAATVHGNIPKLQIVAIEDFFKGKLPKLPPLEHLPSAAFSTPKRRPSISLRLSDPDQREMQFTIPGGKATKGGDGRVLAFNPKTVGTSAG